MPTIVVGCTPQSDDTVNYGAELDGVFGKQIHRSIAKTRQCLGAVLSMAPFGHVGEAVEIEDRH